MEFNAKNDIKRQSFLVYFNGIEIPVKQVSVSSGVWRIPEASIVVPPDATLTRLGREDKIQVAIFYLDNYYQETPTFRLLFDGEITGWGYRNHANSRSMEFKAIGHAAILTQLFPYFMTNLDSMAAGYTDHSTVGKGYVEYKNTMTVSLLYRGLNVGSGEQIKKPFDFVENIFKALYGVSDAYLNGSVTQYFFGKWARLTNFHNRWVPSPYFEYEDLDPQVRSTSTSDGVFPILRAVQSEQSVRALGNMMQRIGNEGSFWALLKHIFSMVYYEVLINPAPAMASVDLETGKILGEPEYDKPITETDEGRFSKDPKKPNRLLSHITKPNLLFAIPPSCNVIYPSMIKTFGYQDNFATEPTRIYLSDKTLAELFSKQTEGIENFLIEARTIAFPPEVKKIMELKKKAPMISGHNLLVWPQEFYKGPVIISHTAPSWLYFISKHYAGYTTDAPKDSIEEKVNKILESSLYNLYAAMEFYREKYSQKYGAIDTIFNPYIVPGFPGIIIDHTDGGIPVNMYVLSVTHTLGQGFSNTSISYSFAQTIEEHLHDLAVQVNNNGLPPELEQHYKEVKEQIKGYVDKLEKKGELSQKEEKLMDSLVKYQVYLDDMLSVNSEVAPAIPLPDIKYRFQIKSNAEQYYAALFHRKVIDSNPQMSELKEVSTLPTQIVNVVFDEETSKFENIPLVVKYELQGKHKVFADVADKAMKYISRPVCTLEEYIDFLGDRGRRRAADYVRADDPELGKGAPYYTRIAEYAEGPGTEPPRDDKGYYIGAPKADTREAWSKRLLRYRQKVLKDLYPHRR